ncbi:MAG: Ig-like domain-containing protein, partial [Desulfobulbales bacterium]|nr:Ig-like domain-containing protein [Desulfobulbales bacterium]
KVTVKSLITNDTTPELTGTVDDITATIQVTVNGSTYTTSNNGNGTWTLADNTIAPALEDGIYDIAVTATDAANNPGSDTTADELTVDTIAPVITINLTSTSDRTPELKGTVDDAAATIQVTVNGISYEATNNGDGTWSLADDTITPELEDGIYDIAATATDAADNTGSDSTTYELTVLNITETNDSDQEDETAGTDDSEESQKTVPESENVTPEPDNPPFEPEEEYLPSESEPEGAPSEPEYENAGTADGNNTAIPIRNDDVAALFLPTEVNDFSDLDLTQLAIEEGDESTISDYKQIKPAESSPDDNDEKEPIEFELPPVNHLLDEEIRASIERTNDSIDAIEKQTTFFTFTVKGATITLSSGLALWVLRAGSLAASAVTSMPIWKGFDLLPVLPLSDRKRREKIKAMQSVEKVEKKEYKQVADLLDNGKTKK